MGQQMSMRASKYTTDDTENSFEIVSKLLTYTIAKSEMLQRASDAACVCNYACIDCVQQQHW